MLIEGLKLFGRGIDIVDNGITAEDLGELIGKIHWCQSVGLQHDPMRIQPYTWCKIQEYLPKQFLV